MRGVLHRLAVRWNLTKEPEFGGWVEAIYDVAAASFSLLCAVFIVLTVTVSWVWLIAALTAFWWGLCLARWSEREMLARRQALPPEV